MAWKKSTTTKHTCGGPVFGHKTKGCPRCDELLAGADPVKWNKAEKISYRDRMRHDCVAARCSIVCTWGDW